jgi:membrane protein DedA with SNARE-associated domain
MGRIAVTLFEAIGTFDPQTIKHYVLHHKAWAGPILGGLAFGESLVLVGLFFPATFIMVFAGLAVQQGKLDGATVIAWSIAGAVAGDAVTYWIGRWIGPSVVHHWPLNRHKAAAARARLFFRKYGFLSIFIGRFLGPVRPTIPLVGGIMRMRHLTFQIANVTSAIAWVPFMLFWGYIFSKAVGDLSALTAGHWIALVALVIAVMVGITTATVKMQGKSAKDRRLEEAQRRAAWHAHHPKHAPHPKPSPAPLKPAPASLKTAPASLKAAAAPLKEA